MTPAADLSTDLARFAATTRFSDLPPDVVDAAKKSLLDTIGVILAASGTEPAVRPLIELVQGNGGREECSILGFGGRVPASAAALANGALAHALDFDDQTPWGAHPDSSVVPTVLALAELKGDVTGEELIAAVAVGQELFIRLRRNVGWHMDWNLSTVVGCFSAATAGASVMKLSVEQTAHALGIASMQSGGTMELIFGTGSDLRGMYAGFTSQACVTAVLLAQRGMTGIRNLFEGEAGHFRVYFKGEFDREKMLQGLGREFHSGGMLYKYWPAVGNAHTYIHASIELMRENGLIPDDVEEVLVHVGDFQQRMCSPLDQRQAPGTLVDAKFSLPFLVGLSLAKGSMRISDFSTEALKDPVVLALARKVVPVPDSSYDWTAKLPDGKVVVVTRDGRRLERLGSMVPGSADRPMTWDELFDKFRDCAVAAARPLPEATIADTQKTIRDLETCGSISTLLRLLA
ncbi:MmgE/PrpD family protein [Aureimonas sp. AU22]|uniref:MmgE/PrpD family protein n=1 Tax=Aureimonas sp. AU22 TaxID=1638162 RepID=UPI000785A520|nr:MmgE/PrpD family protein [Aureimonas sp. AU22]